MQVMCPHCSGQLYRDEDGMRRCLQCSRSPDTVFRPAVKTGKGYPRGGWTPERREAIRVRLAPYRFQRAED